MSGKLDFILKVCKEEVVAAALPMQEHWLAQSNLDLFTAPVDVGVFFCYKKPLNSGYTFDSMVSVLKGSLAQTLVPYYAFSGELVQNVAGEPELFCNNRGVDFSEAYADIELQELNLYDPDESLEGKLVPIKKQGVLAIQATEFKCGGLILGCKFDHRVADAYSANMFFVSWAEISCAKPIYMVPSFRRSLLTPRRPGGYDSSVTDMYLPLSKSPTPPEDLFRYQPNLTPISRIYCVKAEKVNELQSLASGNNNQKLKRTKFEAFSAFIWKIIAKGTDEKNDKNCRLGIVVDGRTRLDKGENSPSNLMSTYFGNVLSIPFGEKKNKELKEMKLSQVAQTVHEFLRRAVTKDHFLGLIDYVEAHRTEPTPPKISLYKMSLEEPAILVSSGQRFPVGKIDFGFGKPTFGSYYFPWGPHCGYVMPMPSASGNGDWIVYMSLLKEQIEAIETCASYFFEPMTTDYLSS